MSFFIFDFIFLIFFTFLILFSRDRRNFSYALAKSCLNDLLEAEILNTNQNPSSRFGVDSEPFSLKNKCKDVCGFLFSKVSSLTSKDAKRTLRTHRILAGAIKLNKSPSAPDELAQYIIAYENLKKACDSQNQEEIESALQMHNKALTILREKYNPKIHKVHIAGLGVIAVAVVGISLLSGIKKDPAYEEIEDSNSIELIEKSQDKSNKTESKDRATSEESQTENSQSSGSSSNEVTQSSSSEGSTQNSSSEDSTQSNIAELQEKAEAALAAGDTETAALYQEAIKALQGEEQDESNENAQDGIKDEAIKELLEKAKENKDDSDIVIASNPEEEVNKLGENLTWTCVSGILRIGGSGDMLNFSRDNLAPWSSFAKDIQEVIISESVKSIGSYAFYNCDNLRKVSISEDVTSLGAFAFASCGKLEGINIPKSVTEIGSSAFISCKELKEVKINGPITAINSFTFYNCRNLKYVALPDTIIDIKDHAFSLCINLGQVDLPSSLVSLGDCSFFGCSVLKQIAIPETVASIDNYAFFDCSNLSKIIFKGDYPQIGSEAFKWVTADIYYPANNQTWGKSELYDITNYGGKKLDYADKNNSKTNADKLSGIVGDETTTSILHWEITKDGCLKLRWGKNLSEIPDFSFDKLPEWCKYSDKIKTVELPDNTRYIGAYTFYGCKNITEVKLTEEVTSVGYAAFAYCSSLKEINLTRINLGDYAFYGCSSLKTVSSDNFYWKCYIGKYAFYECGSLENIDTKAVEEIDDHAFAFCTSLQEVALTDELKKIGNNAFFGCNKLKNINIPEQIGFMGSYVFFDCHELSNVTFKGQIPHITETTFAGTEAVVSYPSKIKK